MADQPRDLARRLSRKPEGGGVQWRRESFALPRAEARKAAEDWFQRYPKAAYMTEIESWRS